MAPSAAPGRWGTVDGHSFYFRERHDHWRIELDLRPTGHFSQVWEGGDLDDEASFEPRAIEVGDVIAEGTIGFHGYGDSPLERLTFIVRSIRAHFGRIDCEVHTSERGDLETLFGRAMSWCPACGEKLA